MTKGILQPELKKLDNLFRVLQFPRIRCWENKQQEKDYRGMRSASKEMEK